METHYLLQIDSVSLSFSDLKVLSDVSANIQKGKITGIVGPGGSGKSLLLKIIAKVLQPTKGSLQWKIKNPSIGMLFQEGALFDSLTVLENVAFPLREGRKKVDYKSACQRAAEVLKEVGLGGHEDKQPGQLSGGMRKRVAFARAFVSKPDLLLLDEPTGGLDPVTSSKILSMVRECSTQIKATIVIVSQDVRRLLSNVDEILALESGAVAWKGPRSALREKAPESVINFLAKRYNFEKQDE